MARAFVFPGQGSQTVGMGADLAAASTTARLVFEEVDDALSQKLSKLMFEGPIEDLTLTANAQPALMAVSVALMRTLEKDGGVEPKKAIRFVAGHSLGEYSALCAVGALTLPETARLLRRRGDAMQKAVPVGAGAMAAILGLDLEVVQDIAARAAEGAVCDCANDNAVGQVVVSGDAAAVGRAVELAKEQGGRRSILLPVSAPFHCALMQPAADVMAEALAETAMRQPAVPVITNVTAAPESNPDELKQNLVTQVTAMVRWRESMLAMKADEVENIFEIGNGKTLTQMLKRIDRSLSGTAVNGPDDIDALLKIL